MKQPRITKDKEPDPLSVQISIMVKRPKGVRITKNVLQEAVQWKLKDKKHRDPPGFKIRIVSWTNPSRPHNAINPKNKLPLDVPRSYGSQFKRWETLRRPLLRMRLDIKEIRTSK